MLSKRELGIRQGCTICWVERAQLGPPGPAFFPYPVSSLPDSPLTVSPSPAAGLLLGITLPKFTWQEGQKRLLLIGCVLLLIALVVSLIILCEFNRGSKAGPWSSQGGEGLGDACTQQGDKSGEHTLAAVSTEGPSYKWP